MKRSCNKCGVKIPFKVKIDGKTRNLKNRKFCLDCSPFGKHNTRDITKPKVEKTKSNSQVVCEYRRRLKLKLIAHKGGKCQLCGYDKPVPGAYDFHHRDPSQKSFGISGSTIRAWKVLVKELEKCDLLCRNCHAEVHHNESLTV